MIVSDNAMQAEKFCDSFQNLRKSSAEAVEQLATNVFKNSGISLDINAKIVISAVFEGPKDG